MVEDFSQPKYVLREFKPPNWMIIPSGTNFRVCCLIGECKWIMLLHSVDNCEKAIREHTRIEHS